MIWISVGKRCNVKHQINKWKQKRETLLFDWLTTHFDSVNYLLENYTNIEMLFQPETIQQCSSRPWHNETTPRMIMKAFPAQCEAIHDIHRKNFDKNDIQECSDKYIRRARRIIEYIKGVEPIVFLRFNDINPEQRQAFIKNVLHINPKCDFTLVSINEYANHHSVIKKKHSIEINLYIQNIKQLHKQDWSSSYIQWKSIFKLLDNII